MTFPEINQAAVCCQMDWVKVFRISGLKVIDWINH